MPDDPDDDPADELFGLPLDQFVTRRNELARELRGSGDRTRAAEVAALRRPSPSAWALDQVARRHPDVVAGVGELGGRFRNATDAALAGDARDLRDVQAEARTFVERVVAAAMSELRAVGRTAGDPVRRRIGDTVHAALVDPAVAEELAGGRLTEDRDASGFGFAGGAAPVGDGRAGSTSSRRREVRADDHEREEERRRARQEERERRERERERQKLAERAEQLEERAATAEARARDLRAQADAARAEADAAG